MRVVEGIGGATPTMREAAGRREPSVGPGPGGPLDPRGLPRFSRPVTTPEVHNAAIFGDMPRVRSILLADPSAVNARDEFGFTALHGVAGEEQLDMARYLVERGADVNARNDKGATPLHCAANPKMAKLLASLGADLNAATNEGDTPLIALAAEPESGDVMAILVKLGADVHARNARGQSALDIARRRQEPDKVKLLTGHGAK